VNGAATFYPYRCGILTRIQFLEGMTGFHEARGRLHLTPVIDNKQKNAPRARIGARGHRADNRMIPPQAVGHSIQ
jgi:hypothetical protein